MTTTQAPPPVICTDPYGFCRDFGACICLAPDSPARAIPTTDDAACIKYRTRLCHNCAAGNFGGTCYCSCECPDNCGRKGGSHEDPLRPGHKTCKHKNHKRQTVVEQRQVARANARREADKLAAKVQGNINRLFPAPAAKPIVVINDRKAAAARQALAARFGVRPAPPVQGPLAWLELD